MMFTGYWYMVAMVYGADRYELKLEDYKKYETQLECMMDLKEEQKKSGKPLLCIQKHEDEL